MKLKDDTINVTGLLPVVSAQFPIVEDVFYALFGYEPTITSGMDGKHSATYSRHYCGLAFDLRTWTTANSGVQISPDERAELTLRLRQALPQAFYIRSESNHIHISFKPSSAQQAQVAIANAYSISTICMCSPSSGGV